MLKSNWFLAILGVILGIGTTVGVVLKSKDEILAGPDVSGPTLPYPANAPRDWVFWTEDINRLATDLTSERAALEQRRKDLDALEARLATERDELRKVRSEIDLMRREVTENIPSLQAAEKQNIKNLAKTYSAMKPQDAMTVLREMDDASVVKILSVMKAEVVATIFQEMAKARDLDGTLAARAARISDQLRLVRNDATPATRP